MFACRCKFMRNARNKKAPSTMRRVGTLSLMRSLATILVVVSGAIITLTINIKRKNQQILYYGYIIPWH